MQAGEVYGAFTLRISDDKFVIRPFNNVIQQPIGNESLIIDRVSGHISVGVNPVTPHNAAEKQMYGIFGIIRLIAGPYLVVITKRELVGTINHRNVYRVAGTEMYPFTKSTLHLKELQASDNRVLVRMVETVLDLKSYYFATDFDITHSLQRLANKDPQFLQMPLHERADQRFVWNNFMLRDLAQTPEAHRYTTPVMLGFVEMRQCQVAGHDFKLALVSRRSRFRAGVRFQIRGIDSDGHAANFIEIEQIVEYGNICSFVQTRGSAPIYWSQKPNLQWQPKPKIDRPDQLPGFKQHFEAQVLEYGHQCIVSLVNLSGRELTVALVMRRLMLNNPPQNVKLVEFDFHKEGYMRLAHLVSEVLAEDCDNYGYFAMRLDGQVPVFPMQQGGVFRTNCMDSLDRTNVVQSMLAKRVLQQQLQLEVLADDDDLSQYADFDRQFKHLWADNGDTCSKQYAGTVTLKGDVTRTGIRTKMGALNDGRIAVTRWYVNNFTDGYRQDAINLCLGKVDVDELEPGIFSNRWDWHAFVIVGLVLAFGMLLLSFFVGSESSDRGIIFLVFVILAAFVLMRGEKFVDNPKLPTEED